MPVLVTDRYRLQKSMEVISPPTPVQRTAAEKVTTYDPVRGEVTVYIVMPRGVAARGIR